MDPEISIMFQCPFQAGFTEDMVRAEISPRYNRRILPEYEPQIAAVWEACRHSKPWLFNGSKFRIHSAAMERGVLIFRLGLTCYRDFIGTNWSSQAAYLQQRGQADFEDSQAYLAEPLGVGAMLHTADDYFVFLRRSLHVGEAAGLIDIPGGHPEPKAVAQGVPEESINPEDLSEDLVVQELFSSILMEIRDEMQPYCGAGERVLPHWGSRGRRIYQHSPHEAPGAPEPGRERGSLEGAMPFGKRRHQALPVGAGQTDTKLPTSFQA
ncbi:uridine diphosphate glucose pyrophosphatase isoform X4 [Rhinatrema bivittatum]|uniref:uridine diphosphate glucose pyrophosphatase isoform X4 n=1 Tax=Rhinatrema bivittatum TaxID=194408 RepID=UPI00112D6AD6|nr:uridine diphosphate glucose pyrophosphatase isoform X4 [Rhinatrema bivittatum]